MASAPWPAVVLCSTRAEPSTDQNFGTDHFSVEVESRVQLNDLAFAMIDDHPVVGVGLNNFQQRMEPLRQLRPAVRRQPGAQPLPAAGRRDRATSGWPACCCVGGGAVRRRRCASPADRDPLLGGRRHRRDRGRRVLRRSRSCSASRCGRRSRSRCGGCLRGLTVAGSMVAAGRVTPTAAADDRRVCRGGRRRGRLAPAGSWASRQHRGWSAPTLRANHGLRTSASLDERSRRNSSHREHLSSSASVHEPVQAKRPVPTRLARRALRPCASDFASGAMALARRAQRLASEYTEARPARRGPPGRCRGVRRRRIASVGRC